MADEPASEGDGANASSVEPVSTGYSNYVLALLFVVYVFNFIDRQVLSILLPNIKADIGVSDTYMGFLTGFAFVVFYTFAGIPIARLADRASRRTIISVGLLVWSTFTSLSGLVANFWQLAAARVGVGVGEAAGSPPAHSLLSDYFRIERRATALAIYAMGVYLGVAIAFVGGAWIASNFGWRTVYIVVGLMGIPLAVLVRFTIRELPRGFSDAAGVQAPEVVPFGEAMRSLRRNRSFVLVVTATSVQSLTGYGVMAWGPTFLMRVHEMPQVDVGLYLGLSIGLFGCLGASLGGLAADRLGRKDERWYMRLPAIEALLAVPFALGFLLAGDPTIALICFAPFYFLGAMYIGPMISTIQNLVAPGMRATASAINLFIVNMIGLGLGPFLVGLMNDVLADRFGVLAIRYSMVGIAVVGLLAAVLFWMAGSRLPQDLATARGPARAD